MSLKYEIPTADAASTLTELWGWSAEETASAAATIYLRKTDGTGDKVVRINLAADETANMEYASGIKFDDVIHFDLSAGTAEVTLYGR